MSVVLLLAVGLVRPAVVGAREPRFVADSLLLPRVSRAKLPSGGMEDWAVLRLVRVSRTRFLALLEHSAYRWDPWAENGGAGTTAGRHGGSAEDLRDDLVLAIVNDRGTILYETVTPHASTPKGRFFNATHDVPLVLEANDDCPYALLDAGSGVLLCYDEQLALTRKYELPLEEIGYPKVSFDGKRSTLWVFGAELPGSHNANAPAGEMPDGDHGPGAQARFHVPPGLASAYGVRFDFRRHGWEPIPVDGHELLTDLERLARGPGGERVQLQPGSLRITPFRDLDADRDFPVVIEAVTAKRYDDRALFSGTRLFFRSTLGPDGLGAVEQLPLWIVQEDRADVTFDPKRGVFRFPRSVWEKDLQPFALGANDLTLVVQAVFKLPREDGSYGKTGHLRQMMLLFSGKNDPPRLVDLSRTALWEPARKDLASDDLKVYPMELRDRTGPSEFAFRTVCKNPRDNESPPCVAIMTLEY
ncbi:MAG TPA: hypothetical protein ENK19_09060 [Acidobacteria bacterium]|nr:hypothetical protein [Acidobacteriota bacterium]